MTQPVLQRQVAHLESRDPASLKGWSTVLALGIGIAVLSLMFLREIRSAIDVWNASTAYSHCYLVLPMTFYLLWERRDVISWTRVQPQLQFALLGLPLTIAWLVAERLGFMEGRQLAFICSVQVLCLVTLGRRYYLQLSGPLLFLFFLVPFGAFLTPILQQFTAKFSIVGLDFLGIPNYSDKFVIETPAGVFFVAEACAGLRFLIAAIAFGVFYSILSYTSYFRRTVFIFACVIVPVIANGFRALGIVVLGQLLGSAEAAAADHIIYGWAFFSSVMLLLIAGGHAFRENLPLTSKTAATGSMTSTQAPFWYVASLTLLLGLGPAFAALLDLNQTAPVLPKMSAIIAPADCLSVSRIDETSQNKQRSTIICGDSRFEVSVVVFAARSTSTPIVSERRRVTQENIAEDAAVSELQGPDQAIHWTLIQTTSPNRLTAYAVWVDGIPMASNIAGRIAQAHDSIFGAAYAPALLTITVTEPASDPPVKRDATLERLTKLLLAQSNLVERMAAWTILTAS